VQNSWHTIFYPTNAATLCDIASKNEINHKVEKSDVLQQYLKQNSKLGKVPTRHCIKDAF
jgi:hypothetical protein